MKSVQVAILALTGATLAVIGLLPRILRFFERPLRVSDRIRLSGGYDTAARWLGTGDHVDGEVVRFIENAVRGRAAVVKLAVPISSTSFSSDIAVLYLRFQDARWSNHEIVHVELWRHVPRPEELTDPSDEDRQWIESHASYRTLS